MLEAGDGVEVEYIDKFTDQTVTSVASDDPWYNIPILCFFISAKFLVS
jgi:hypothetical protein